MNDVTGRKAICGQSVDNCAVSAVVATCVEGDHPIYSMLAEAAAKAMADKSEIDLLEQTIPDLEFSLAQLELRINSDMREFRARSERLEIWRRRLAELKGVNEQATAVVDRDGRRPRNRKGANLRAIMGCLEIAIMGRSASEIQRETQLPWSSVQSTLKNNQEVFFEENGLWKLKREPLKTIEAATNEMINN